MLTFSPSRYQVWFILLTVFYFPQVEIHHASEVDEIFDAISYDKGASVIRMLQNYLGAERFQVWIVSLKLDFSI